MIERTTSTSGSTGTGLKKCSPSTRSGRRVPAPSFMIGTEEVLEARNSRVGQELVELGEEPALRRLVLHDRLDRGVGPLEILHGAREGDPLVGRGRGRRSTACPTSRPGRATWRSPRARARRARRRARRRVTSTPERAQTSAMPEPISPPPTTPIRMGGHASADDPRSAVARPRGARAPARRTRSSTAGSIPAGPFGPRRARRRSGGRARRVGPVVELLGDGRLLAVRVDVDHVVHGLVSTPSPTYILMRSRVTSHATFGGLAEQSRRDVPFEESPDIAGQGGR